MFGKMFLSFFLVIAVWSASTIALEDQLIHCIDVEPFSVEENGKTYQYNSNLIGFKFNPGKVAVQKNKNSDTVNLSVKDVYVTFQAMSIATKSYFETEIVGLAREKASRGTPLKRLSNCYVRAQLKNDNETNGLPSKMVKAILEKASECMNKKLCDAIGTVGEEEYNRA